MGGRNDSGEGDKLASVKGKPPVALIKLGNGAASRNVDRSFASLSAISSSLPSTSRIRYTAGPEFVLIDSIRCVHRSFPERCLDAEPHGPDQPGYDHREDHLGNIALCLLDTSAPASHMLKISANLFSIFLVDPE